MSAADAKQKLKEYKARYYQENKEHLNKSKAKGNCNRVKRMAVIYRLYREGEIVPISEEVEEIILKAFDKIDNPKVEETETPDK